MTVEELIAADKQTVFNKVKEHLLTQKVKCKDEAGTSCWRNSKGQSCAIGCLLDDDVIDELMEKQWTSCGDLNLGYEMPLDTYYFLTALQSIHDCNKVKDWPALLDDFTLGNRHKDDTPNT